MVLEKTLESPLDCKKIQPVNPKGNQSWIFIEGLTLMLKLQYFGHLIQTLDSFEKTLMLGKVECKRRRGWQRMRWLDGITDSVGMSSRKPQIGRPGVLQSMGSQKVRFDWVTELNWVVYVLWSILRWTVSLHLDRHPLRLGGQRTFLFIYRTTEGKWID